MTHSIKISFLAKLSFLIVLLSCLTASPVIAQEGQAIGRVLTTSGSVTALDLNGVLRELSRRSDIFVGDTVVTGPNGFAQLRMVDSAQISFKEDTEFTFSEYSSDGPGGAADSALMEMVRGGFRTISGTIGDDDADDYQVSTQFASIGIRGTTHEAVIDANSLLTGVYDGGTTIANGQGTLDTGEGANFDYSQTFPGQAPQGLLQQPAQLGNINLNGGDGDDDDGDDGDGDGDDGDGNDDGDGDDGDGDDGDGNDGDGDDGANDGDDNDGNDNGNDGDDNAGGDDEGGNGNNDGGDGDGNGGIADAGDAEAGARDPVNPPNTPPGGGLANQGGDNTNVDPTLDTNPERTVEINPVVNVRTREDFEETGSGTLEAQFAQPNEAFLALASNSGFNTDFSLSELQGVTGRFSEVLAFNGLADTGGISAAAVGDNGPTTSITSLTMTFDLNFSASLARVSNGFLGIKLDDAPTPIAFNIFFSGDIIDSQSNFTLSSNSNRVQGSQSTAIDLQTSFLNSILVDDGREQALFSDFFFEDTQGLGVEGQALVGFSQAVLSPADNIRISDRVGFVLSRSAAPGAIFPGNVTELIPGQEVILAGNDLSSPFTLDSEPPYIFRGAGSFIDFTDGTITQTGERPYDFEIGIWGSSSDPVALYTDFTDRSIFELIEDPLIVVSVDPAPISDLSGNVIYMTNFDRILGGSSAGIISRFFTGFNVDFSASLITDGFMEFCIGGGASCSGSNAQFWDFDFSGAVANGFVIASPVNNAGQINGQMASIFGFIEGVFTGGEAEAFVGGFNLLYDDDLDIYRGLLDEENVGIPDTTVDGVFLIEQDLRLGSAEFDTFLDNDSMLLQEGYARILRGASRPTTSDPILFVDEQSRPRWVLSDPDNEVSITQRNSGLSAANSEDFGVDWERWDGPLTVFTDNLDVSVFDDGAVDSIHDVAFFSTFKKSEMQGITGHFDTVLGFIGEGDAGTPISALEMSFDVNFSAATSMNNIENGKILIDVGAGQSWLAFFEGELTNNTVEFDILDANPLNMSETSGIFNGSWTLLNDIDTADSRLHGVIVDDETRPALLSSFYFREKAPYQSMYLREGVMGMSLVGLTDARLNTQDYDDLDHHIGMLVETSYFDENNMLVHGSISFGASNHPWDEEDESTSDVISPKFGINNRNNQSIPDFSQPFPQPFDEVISATESSTQDISNYTDDIVTYVGGYRVDMGYWDSANMTILNNQYTASSTLMAEQDALWSNIHPLDIADLSGYYTYDSSTGYNDFIGTGNNGNLTGFSMDFYMDFDGSGGGILKSGTTGSLSATDSAGTWNASFTGVSLNGAIATMSGIAGSFTGSGMSIDSANSAIAGVFAQDSGGGMGDNAFVAGFSLSDVGGLNFIEGIGLLDGLPYPPP